MPRLVWEGVRTPGWQRGGDPPSSPLPHRPGGRGPGKDLGGGGAPPQRVPSDATGRALRSVGGGLPPRDPTERLDAEGGAVLTGPSPVLGPRRLDPPLSFAP